MMTWAIINATASAIDALIIAYELRCYFESLSLAERLGRGLTGAALILTIGPIIANGGAPYLSRAGTPFNMWPSFLLRVGIATVFTSRVLRTRRHNIDNLKAVAQARAYFAERGL